MGPGDSLGLPRARSVDSTRSVYFGTIQAALVAGVALNVMKSGHGCFSRRRTHCGSERMRLTYGFDWK
jgi:hypothetical protein